jgi:predicted nucleic acid-binding protein
MGLELKKINQVFLDTAPFIYYFEENPRYIDTMVDFWDQVYLYKIKVITSIITYIELLTFPEKENNHLLASQYREALTNSEHISIYPLNILVADATVRFRAQYSLKTPDAIQLATADICGAELILTNDSAWTKTEISRIVLLDELVGKSL